MQNNSIKIYLIILFLFISFIIFIFFIKIKINTYILGIIYFNDDNNKLITINKNEEKLIFYDNEFYLKINNIENIFCKFNREENGNYIYKLNYFESINIDNKYSLNMPINYDITTIHKHPIIIYMLFRI